jgi:hypothetical protein
VSETFTWIDADGGSLVIGGPGVNTYQVDWKVTGRFMPKPRVQSHGVPGQPGAVLDEVNHDPRDFVLPLSISATSESNLRVLMRDLMYRMNPKRGQGKLRVTSPVGDQREITCLYSAGLEGDETEGASGPTFQAMPLVLTAFDPYWYDVSPTSQTFALTSLPSFFPIFPLRLTASQLVVDDTVTNAGDEETWPVWTIAGPGSAVTLRNSTTGLLISIPSIALTAGQVLTIDTRPGKKSVTLNDGTDLFSSIDHTVSSLWSLRVGLNAIRLEMTGITAASALSVSYYQRYLTP